VRHSADGRERFVTDACGCGKLSHESRASAKAHAKRLKRTAGEHLRPYPCPERPAFWHVGHLPQLVLKGYVTADEHYGKATRGR
jgi:hypothetical protein